MNTHPQTEQTVSLQINTSTLLRLIRENGVRLNDIHCLDKQSKETVRQSFLQSMLRQTT
ncbi:hypothetical protein KO525_09265 [Psychrosphaera sp. B3R10]|uniref:Uncharacterized protein n=1 Tax=Psychrosphaera algicola TaxID=3023714 RepID=A0ABT5FCX7_9GAMM|nr:MULTISPECIES: hypothetical protein [unclassified Psychrosphaera]MBU2881424.1 hypothetical protein [Psychrosphaera sp. I2R16]MBU2989564.1 hypothetical protein [Psychrosphaera sp. B3R10]MDC2888894.1 hypothetical protein [Psychrosphaera sp. G1-22]MDO6719281.1 hypothetical protein [Psychrosphaera sp. 1_MG-2023]